MPTTNAGTRRRPGSATLPIAALAAVLAALTGCGDADPEMPIGRTTLDPSQPDPPADTDGADDGTGDEDGRSQHRRLDEADLPVDDHHEHTEADYTGELTAADAEAARSRAVEVVEAVAADVDDDWWQDLAPMVTTTGAEDFQRFADGYSSVEFSEVTSDAEIVESDTTLLVTVTVPTDAEEVTVLLSRTDAEADWLAQSLQT